MNGDRLHALGAVKPSRVSMGVILDEPMLIAFEGVEGYGGSPARFHSVFCVDASM